ncbi:hypothetical protein CEXT_329871 [Caerostris extrusa]|uniref:Uncharacterized protein n=1 Tax=Caerostris extrusa TaxID=172846 RepID=A0AAV4U9G7_CAEEX|nr:hypothetical protein CEXT_329871 [Caerostris extrusa]
MFCYHQHCKVCLISSHFTEAPSSPPPLLPYRLGADIFTTGRDNFAAKKSKWHSVSRKLLSSKTLSSFTAHLTLSSCSPEDVIPV